MANIIISINSTDDVGVPYLPTSTGLSTVILSVRPRKPKSVTVTTPLSAELAAAVRSLWLANKINVQIDGVTISSQATVSTYEIGGSGNAAPSSGGTGDAPSVSTTTDANLGSGVVGYIKATGNIGLADAGAISTSDTMGISQLGFLSGATAILQTEGVLELADWSAAIGGGSLIPGTTYYLGSAGAMVTVPPTIDHLVVIGKALSTTSLDIGIQQIGLFV